MAKHHELLTISKDASVAKLSNLALEEQAFKSEKKHLHNTVPREQDHLFDGLLYFRVSESTATTTACVITSVLTSSRVTHSYDVSS